MVKKRVIPCLDVANGRVVKGVNFVGLREMGEPIELATRVLGARCRRARLPRHHRDARGPRADPRADRARRRGADDPVHGRGRRHRPRRCALASPRRRGQGRRSTAPPSTTRRSSPPSPRSSARRPSSARSTRRRGRSSRTPGRTRAAATPSTGRVEAVERGAGELLVTSIDADGTRAGYDLRSRARSRRRSRCR